MIPANNTFVITGGSSGLGAATCRRLVGVGANVLIADVNASTGEALAAEIGQRAVFAATDVTSAESAQGAINGAIQRFGALHGLINCAGILGASRIVGRDGPHDLGLFQKVIQ